MHTAGNLRQALRHGWKLVLDSWSVWLLLAATGLFFIRLQQRLLHPALAQLLPRIPAPDTSAVPAESYSVLLMEGAHQLLASDAFRRLLLALGMVALLKGLLQPFLHIFVFSPLAQPSPTVSYYLLWKRLAHRFPAFCTVALIQWLCIGLGAAATGLSSLYLAEDVWRTGSVGSAILLVLLIVSAGALAAWGFTAFTLWQAALALGDDIWSGMARAWRWALRRRPARSIFLSAGFWLLSAALGAAVQLLVPAAQWGVWLAGVLLPLPFLWLTYTLASAFSMSREA